MADVVVILSWQSSREGERRMIFRDCYTSSFPLVRPLVVSPTAEK